MDSDRIFLRERGQLIKLSERFRRPRPPPPSRLAASSWRPSSPATPSATSSLASLACHCICRHFDRVDSFFGLPDDLGRLLFDAAMAQGLFQPPMAPRSVHLFAEAFGATFAAQLNLSGVDFRALPILPAIIPHLKAITVLTLDGCHLYAAETSLLAEIGRLPQLRQLSLRASWLLDANLRTLSAPWRFRPKACAIQSLDVRDNKYLTSKGLNHLLEVHSLRTVVFTSSCDLEDNLPLARCSKFRWRISRSCPTMPPVDTRGWIHEVLNVWRQEGILETSDAAEDLENRVLVLQRTSEFVSSSNLGSERKKKRLNIAEAADLAML